MHEFSIATSIVETVEEFAEKQGARKVVEVRMIVGELTCVEPDQLKFCFDAITGGSSLEEAVLEIETGPALVHCPQCAYDGPPKYWEGVRTGSRLPTLECPHCGRTTEATAGHECAIKSVKFVRDDHLEQSAA